MLDPQITTVLFDLDGTLLPMELEKFTNTYFGLLAKKAAPFGFQPEPLVAAVWKGTKAMVKNDGTETNDKRFWDTFAGEMGEEVLQLRPVFDGFYANEFHGAKAACGENPLARRAIDGLKAKGYDVVLATNPIFPLVGVETRLSWVGLRPEDFSYITAYENSTTCKPNPAYYAEILRNTGKRPQECLMGGQRRHRGHRRPGAGHWGLPGDRLPLKPQGPGHQRRAPGDLRGVFGVCRGVKVFPPFVTRTQKNPGIWGIIKAQKGEYP